MTDAPRRVEIARIIDPEAWTWRPLPRDEVELPATKAAFDEQDYNDTEAMNVCKRAALAKADAILSLPAPAPTPSELVVGDRVRVHTGEEGTIDYFVLGRTKSVHVLIRPGFGGVYFPFECERLPAPAPAPVSSEGFVLVPVEPTEAMLRAAVSGWPTEVRRVLSSTWALAANTYDAMIAAAPSPDQPSEEIEN